MGTIAVNSPFCTLDPNSVFHSLRCTLFASYPCPMMTARGSSSLIDFEFHSVSQLRPEMKPHEVKSKVNLCVSMRNNAHFLIYFVVLDPRVHINYSVQFRAAQNLSMTTTSPPSRKHSAICLFPAETRFSGHRRIFRFSFYKYIWIRRPKTSPLDTLALCPPWHYARPKTVDSPTRRCNKKRRCRPPCSACLELPSGNSNSVMAKQSMESYRLLHTTSASGGMHSCQ